MVRRHEIHRFPRLDLQTRLQLLPDAGRGALSLSSYTSCRVRLVFHLDQTLTPDMGGNILTDAILASAPITFLWIGNGP